VIGMIDARIDANRNAKGFIFDGFPRTTAQAEVLDKLLSQKNTAISMMLSLEVPKAELIKRLLNRGKDSGRADDQDEAVIEKRITEYNNKTAPLKEYYTSQQKYFGIQGVGTVDEIFNSQLQTCVDGIACAFNICGINLFSPPWIKRNKRRRVNNGCSSFKAFPKRNLVCNVRYFFYNSFR